MCATSGLPSTPSYLLHNTTRVVARTLLHSTVGWVDVVDVRELVYSQMHAAAN